MTKKLIVLDLDGTLLRPDGTISEFTQKTIKDVQNKGHQVVIATGRPYRMAIDHYKTLGLELSLIHISIERFPAFWLLYDYYLQ